MNTGTREHLNTDLLRLEIDDDIAVVWMDQPGAKVNTIGPETLEAFEEALDAVQGEPSVRGVVFISAKEDTFVAGADLEALRGFDGPADAEALSRTAHRLLRRVGSLRTPTVAAIHGAALGGGLELALGCTYRIATDHPATKLALPEVQLGLVPGGGGTQYLPRLIGLQQSFQMMLTGKNIYPRKARRIGLVDALIHRPGLLQAAKTAARELATGARTPEREPLSLTDRLLESTRLSRRIIYQKAEENVRKETRGNYPAPARIIECVRASIEEGLDEGLQLEATRFGELAFTPESQALVSLFFARQAAGKNPLADEARPVETVGVLGAGLMGGGIAAVSAQKGLAVLLKDQDLERAATGRRHVWDVVDRKAAKGILSTFERDRILEHVRPVADYAPLAETDLVIEAVPEDLELRRHVLRDTEAVTKDGCVFASNTSSLPIAEIAEGARRPEAVLGMHYFSPVPQVPLLEIIATDATAGWAVATAYDVGLRQGKTVIVVNDSPGFYTTRILALYMNEALLLLEEGAATGHVDEAMMDWGFPMGPFELFDLVGIEVAAKITEVMQRYFAEGSLGEREVSISRSAQTLVQAGLLGQKSGKGFYTYTEDKRGRSRKGEVNEDVYAFFGGPERTRISDAAIQERLSLMMINEAVYCLQEHVLRSATDGDLGAVFGLGFPPFRGGPFRSIDRATPQAVVARLEALARTHGPRFTPAPLLHRHANEGTRFF